MGVVVNRGWVGVDGGGGGFDTVVCGRIVEVSWGLGGDGGG